MKKQICYPEFEEWFFKNRPDDFSSYGIKAMWDYLKGYEKYIGEEIVFNWVAICCAFSEYANSARC